METNRNWLMYFLPYSFTLVLAGCHVSGKHMMQGREQNLAAAAANAAREADAAITAAREGDVDAIAHADARAVNNANAATAAANTANETANNAGVVLNINTINGFKAAANTAHEAAGNAKDAYDRVSKGYIARANYIAAVGMNVPADNAIDAARAAAKAYGKSKEVYRYIALNLDHAVMHIRKVHPDVA